MMPPTRPALSMWTVAALFAVLICGSPAAAATAKKARGNALKVNGLRASKTPKAGRLLALDKNGKFPASVFPASMLAQLVGPAGAQGPVGPKGATGTVDTSNFFTKAESDGRFLATSGKAADADTLDGFDSSDYLRINPAARQDPPTTGLGSTSLWLRPTVNYQGTSTATSEFKVGNDGSFLTTGALGIGPIPASGCGYRMMWYPYKSAFRAGSPGGCPGSATQWDDANTGFYSWAGGNATTAKAFGTFTFGDGSTASGVDSVALGSSSTSSGTASISCCASSKAEGFGSTTLGFTNRATGQGAVAIGYRSGAFGDYSMALGQRAVTASGCPGSGTCDLNAIDPNNGFDGAFVWADQSSTTSVAATANNQFTARAAGGVRLFTNSALTTGCTLPAGSGVFSCTSDRNAKRDFAPVDDLALLKRLSTVPVTTWRYKTEPGSVRHMGPMAQDFRRAFGLGFDDKHIGSIDEDGVNTAAIQALYKLSRRQQRLLDAQERQIARLERKLTTMSNSHR